MLILFSINLRQTKDDILFYLLKQQRTQKKQVAKNGQCSGSKLQQRTQKNCDINFYVFGSRTMNVNQYWLWVKQFNIYTVQINTLPRQFYEI